MEQDIPLACRGGDVLEAVFFIEGLQRKDCGVLSCQVQRCKVTKIYNGTTTSQ